MERLDLKPGELTLRQLRAVWRDHVPVHIDDGVYAALEASKQTVDDVIAAGKTVYSINTGFGELAKVRIEADRLEELQTKIVLSHATGVGPNIPDHIVRMIILLKLNALAQGYSGVRREIIDYLHALYEKQVYPCIPVKGSVGASGDLAPLAHLSLPLLGLGTARKGGKEISGAEALEICGLEPLKFAPKEGLALLNGTQVSTALALRGLFAAEDCYAAAVTAGALSVDAAKGSSKPFSPEIQRVRRQQGQIDVAAAYMELLDGSEIVESHNHADCEKVQDPYCLRCQPQVMGACLDHMRFAADIFAREVNAVTDNPLVFSDTGKIISGGNFHAEPVAMAADTLALAIAEIGAISERRIAMLIDSKVSGLPPFLVSDAGVNSGFMIAHVTAAALASENKQKSHPACVDSLPTSANQEDHVSMATHGARRLIDMANNTAHIVAIELLAATQGIEFNDRHRTSPRLQEVMALVRSHVDSYHDDHYFAPDIQKATALVENGEFHRFAGRGLLPSLS